MELALYDILLPRVAWKGKEVEKQVLYDSLQRGELLHTASLKMWYFHIVSTAHCHLHRDHLAK